MDSPNDEWFGVRCVLAEARPNASTRYEERITLWRAKSFEEAIARAEEEAHDYAATLSHEYVGLAQAYRLAVDDPPADGDEIFSLIRESDLPPDAYVATFFATGDEFE